VLDELESQNDDQYSVLTGKVKMLKDVCKWLPVIVYKDGMLTECS